jgi:subtilisin family serine protease
MSKQIDQPSKPKSAPGPALGAKGARNVIRPSAAGPAPASRRLQLELEARGVADVIVILKSDVRQTPHKSAKISDMGTNLKLSASLTSTSGGSAAAELARHFVSSAVSHRGALSLAIANQAVDGAARAGTKTSTRRLAASLKRAASTGLPAPARYFPRLGVMLGTVDAIGCKALASDERVASVEAAPLLQLIRPTRSASAKLSRSVTWGIEAMRVPELWARKLSGKGVRVGHLDTGVDGKHPALKSAISGFGFFDSLGNLQQPSPSPFDTDDHGTHTAATIAGRPIESRHVGVAPGALLESACVIEGGDAVARVLGGMDWAIGRGVRVLSMSLGFPGYQPEFLTLTQILREQNILPVFAVGNEGEGTSRSPGNYSEALSVGAADKNRTVAGFSSSDRFSREEDPSVPDLVGPGVDIISARPGGGYQSKDGTSMATPHIAGLAALLIEANPQVTVDQLERAILESCQLGTMAPHRAGRGLPDAVVALSKL